MNVNKRLSLKWGVSLGLLGCNGIGYAQKFSSEGFLACNLRYEFYIGEARASDNNWGEWNKLLPVGTAVKVFRATQRVSNGLGSTRLVSKPNTWIFETSVVTVSFINGYHRTMQDQDLISRFVSSDDPKPRLATFPNEVQQAIGKGRVALGMTREQVAMALGPPPVNENQNPKGSVLSYYWGSFDTLQLIFDSSGKLAEINGLPFVLADLLYEAVK
jgi:hypothetical protein